MSRETEQFFLQAEDGIRDGHVTGVQTCALPILNTATHPVYRDPGPTGPVFGPERVGAGRVDAYAAVGNGVIAYDSAARDLVSVTFGVVDVGAEEVVLRRTVTVQNLGAEGPATFSTGFEATSTTGGATSTTTPPPRDVAPGARPTLPGPPP